MEYEIIRSARRTTAIQIKSGKVIVRAPFHVSVSVIDAFVQEHRAWIERNLAKSQKFEEEHKDTVPYSNADLKKLLEAAKYYIPERVKFYAQIMGLKYGEISFRKMKSKWGTCSSKGDLKFNYLIMAAPKEVIDSVVVHELCHRFEMNHSPRFYAHVYRILPKYKEYDEWLKAHGNEIILRAYK